VNAIVLPSNCPPDRFYEGGSNIRRFRGEPSGGAREPEDWVASTTTLAGEHELGLTVLPDGRRLLDAVAAEPRWWLGDRHIERFGVDTKLLVKLLDAGQRLPVHAHPDAGFARRHLGRAHGKAEAWFMLTGGSVHLGLRESVTKGELLDLVRSQRTERLLDLLHPVDVAAGDVVFVPPGTLHAIGAGVFLVEVQEPEDLSILLEWAGFELNGERDGHLGLGFDVALEAVGRSELDPKTVRSLVKPAGFGASVLPARADEYFRMERRRIDGRDDLEPGIAVVVVTAGAATIGDDEPLEVVAGSTVLLPHGIGSILVQGSAELVICRPPG